jgi:hypothetical protein
LKEKDAARAFEAHFVKPIDPPQLLRTADVLLQRRPSPGSRARRAG